MGRVSVCVTLLSLILISSSLRGDGCEFWFGSSEIDPSPVTQLAVSSGDTITLYAWISADQPSWDWIGAVGFPIVFDTSYLEVMTATFNSELGPTYSPDSLYMFAGVDWPGMGETFADTLESQILWYISVCFNNCLSCDGTPHYLGSATFLVKNPPESLTVVVDTMEYPPSNNALVVDNTGWGECAPAWTPFSIASGGAVVFIRGDANADGNTDVSDAVCTLNNLFPVPNFACDRAADCNYDNSVDITDVPYLLNHLFPQPSLPEPNLTCGQDTGSPLSCDSFPPCEGPLKRRLEENNVFLFLGKPEMRDKDVISVPVYIETSKRLAAFQFKLGYNEIDFKVVDVVDRGTESENFDYFNSYIGDEEIMAAGIVSLQPSTTGQSCEWISPGKYKIARILINDVKGAIKFVSKEIILSDVYGHALIPISSLSVEETPDLPVSYSVSQNEPNPFEGATVIKYALPVDSKVELVIYNAAGQKIRTLVRGYQSAGYRSVRWDGKDDAGRKVSPGVYFYKFKAGEYSSIKKLILAR